MPQNLADERKLTMPELQPGCVLSKSGKYLPVVFEAHGKIYFSGEATVNPSMAIAYAKASIENNSYMTWHSHAMTDENHA